jgi:RimJ/RimL family protein N-acetyltransferase
MAEKEEENMVFPFIKGEKIDLVPQNSKWIPLYSKWDNDPEVRHFARHYIPRTPEEYKRWFEPQSGRGVREGVFFTIYHKIDNCPIGTIGLHRIDWVNRNASIGGLIGESNYWGKGMIGEAARLLINYGFTELNLHKISATILNVNERSLRAAEKLEFKQEGILREHMYVDGKYVDFHQFAILKEEWVSQNKN